MNTKDFNNIIHEQIDRCENTLCKKADEYAANEDRLHVFKVAADLQDCLPTTALGGMMAKHTVSVYDMIRGLEEGKSYPIELWNEKIGDSINYLMLLAAAVREKAENRSDIIHITPKIGETLVQFKQRVIDLAFENKRDAFGEFKGAQINAHYGKRGVIVTVDPSNCSERIVFI